MKEIIVWAHLSHPNILPFYGVYLDDELQRICLLSPWMEKGNLREYLGEHPSTPWSPLVSVVEQVQTKGIFQKIHSAFQVLDIIDGLQYLHALDIIHGDLKAVRPFVPSRGQRFIRTLGKCTAFR